MAKLQGAALVRFWRERIEQQRGSGLSIAAFCRSQGCSPASFHVWKKKLAALAASAAQPSFAAVTLVDTPPPSAERIEIELPQGIVLRLPPGAELRPALVAVLEAVSAGEG